MAVVRPGCSEEKCCGHIRESELQTKCSKTDKPHRFTKLLTCKCMSCGDYYCQDCSDEIYLEFCWEDDEDLF